MTSNTETKNRFKTIKWLTSGILLIARIIFDLAELNLSLLLISLRPVAAIIKTGLKPFHALGKVTLYPLISGIILITRVLIAGIRLGLFLLLLYIKELPSQIITATKAFLVVSRAAFYSLTKGIKAILSRVKAAAKTLYALFKAACNASLRGLKTLTAGIKTTTKAFYAFIKVALQSVNEGFKALFVGIKAGVKLLYVFIKEASVSVALGFQATVRLFYRFIKEACLSIAEGFKALFSGIKTATKHVLLKINRQSLLFDRLKQYALLIRLDKPIGILLLLWPTLMALWIAAGGWPDTNVLLVFVTGVFLMRSAGCAINDYADRDIDCNVTRTKDRPLTSGRISVKETLIIFAVLCLAAFGLVLLMNPLTIVMSLGGLVLAASYPFMKRHHYLPQVHLGAAFGWAVPMAYTAQTNELSPIAWLLFIATVLWTTAYDTMYAMVDREDDLKIGVKSTAILFEDADKLIIGIIQGILILCLIMIGQNAGLGIYYYTGVLLATGLAIWQQHLIRDRQPAQCLKAFVNNNWFGLVLFAGIFLDYQIGGIKP